MDSNHFVIAQTRGLECKNGLGLHDFQQLTTKLPHTTQYFVRKSRSNTIVNACFTDTDTRGLFARVNILQPYKKPLLYCLLYKQITHCLSFLPQFWESRSIKLLVHIIFDCNWHLLRDQAFDSVNQKVETLINF